MSETSAESTPKKSSGEVLFQHPTWKDQILIVPADKADEYKEAGYERVKRDDEVELRKIAVPIETTHKLHFGNSRLT